nr:aluminum-activated malate transporter 8-like isoform X5 [Ipomoea trifida]
MCFESTQALKAISLAIKTTEHPSPAIQDHLRNSRAAIDDLEVVFRSSSLLSTEQRLFDIIPYVAVISILIDIVDCVDKISKSVDELSKKAGFKKPTEKSPSPAPEEQRQQPPQQQLPHRGTVTPVNEEIKVEVVAITIDYTHHQYSSE